MISRVLAVNSSPSHSFSKYPAAQLTLLQGVGVEGDAHSGVTVKHRSRVARDPTQPNLRQVHLMHSELFDELSGKGFFVSPGALGENITTRGIALLDLPVGTELHIGDSAIVKITGLRNPCGQLDQFQPGLMSAVLERTADGTLVRKAGVMSVVLRAGVVRTGDSISATLPPHPHRRLEPV
jgi:MOSC domain-containing protein YiiM